MRDLGPPHATQLRRERPRGKRSSSADRLEARPAHALHSPRLQTPPPPNQGAGLSVSTASVDALNPSALGPIHGAIAASWLGLSTGWMSRQRPANHARREMLHRRPQLPTRSCKISSRPQLSICISDRRAPRLSLLRCCSMSISSTQKMPDSVALVVSAGKNTQGRSSNNR